MKQDWPVKEIYNQVVTSELLPYIIISISYVAVLLSYPMPPSPGWIEVVMGGGLVVGCLILLVRAKRQGLFEIKLFWLSLLAGAILAAYPCFVGVLNGNAIGMVARDFFPVIFLVTLVPLIGFSVGIKFERQISTVLLVSILSVGTISSIEFIFAMRSEYGSMKELSTAFDSTYNTLEQIQPPVLEQIQPPVLEQIQPPALENTFSVRALKVFEPAVTFAAIYCGCMLFVLFLRRQFVLSALCALISALALYGLMALRLRAPVGLFVISELLFITYLALDPRNIKWRTQIVLWAIFICAAGLSMFGDMLWGLVLKQNIVGTNGKLDEWAAVLYVLGDDWQNWLIGIGWGSEFVPNYQIEPVRFTHSMISFVLLKAGLIGLSLLVVVYAHLMAAFYVRVKKLHFQQDRLAILLAGGAVVIIGISLQPIFKMLGFSMILALLFITINLSSEAKE